MELAELDKEFNQRVQEKQNWYNGGYARDVQSNLTPPEVFGFIEEQKTAQQEAAETRGFGTAVWNGLKSGVRGVLGAAKGAIDSNIAEHKKNDPNYRPVNDWAYGVTESLQSGIDSLQREEIKADSAAGQLMYDLTEGAVQLAMQVAVTAATGGTAGAIYMGTTIAGDQYLELRKEGVDAERAMQASLMNAPFQAALEKIGMGKIMAKLPAGSGLRKKLGEVLKSGFEEGITEGLQELPEQFTNIWAKDKNATPESMVAKWGENWEQNVKEAGYSALLGGILGGGAKGLHIITDSVQRKVGEKITDVKKEQLVADAERVAKSGVNPEYAAALIDANSQGETVTVQATDLNALKQQTNGAKLVETLGVTEEQIEQAAENGQDIDISKGRFIAAMVENKGLYEATKDGMLFDINGDLSTNAAENLKTLRADTRASEEQMQRLDLEVKNVVDSAIAAGMNKAHAENLQLMIESRAIIASPENPAAWLQKNKLRFNNAGKKPTSKRGWLQKAWSKRGWKQNDSAIDKGQIRPQEDGSYIIDLFHGADASTVIHETGHYFVDTMINEAALDPSNTRLVRDAKILLEYGGMTMEQWNGASLDEKRAAHEKLAEGFETYIMEGKAPSAGLKKAFERFAKWLTAIYSKIARNENAADLTDDVRGVFDRMLASQEEIEMQAQLNGMFNELPPELTSKLPLEAKNALLDKISKAKEKAVDILTKEMMKDFNANRRAEKEAYIKEITPQIEEYIHAEKVNQGRDLVAYHFGGEREKNAAAFKDENGYAHANRPVKVHRDATPSIIARKYRHAIGSVLPNYNDVLNDTKAAINDRLNTIIEDLKNSIVEYNESLRDAWAQGGAEGYWTFEGESIDPTIIKDYVKANGGKYDDNVRAKLERDGYVFHPADEEVSGGNWYRNYVEVNGKKKLSNKEIERIARDIYSGNDYYGYDPEAKMYEGNPEYEAEMQANKAELDELYRLKERLEKSPEGVGLVQMSKRSALSDEQRVLFETIADEVGYSSGDEMAQDILSKPSERQMVRERVNEAVQARFPDIYAERALAEEKAREALYNDESGEVIALEQQIIESYLNEAVGRQESKRERMDMAKAMKQMAEVKAKNIIQRMTVSDITKGNGRKFMLAERRAAANAAKAIKGGDLDAAMEYKRQQLINHELYRQALQIRGQVKSAQRFIRKMANMKKENFGTQQHFNQIAFLLERMGIKRRGYDREGDNQFLPAYVEEMREKCGAIVDIPEFVLNESNDISSPDNLLFSQYQNVINAMKNIYAIAKYDTRMSKMSKEQTFAETKRDIMEHLRELNDVYTPRLGGDRKKGFIKGFADRIKDYRNVLRNADNFYLAMDNWTDGYFTKNWYDTINHCADAEATMTWEYQDKLANALKNWEPDEATAKAHDADVYYEELGTSTDKNTLVTMLCNLGNEGNKNRLCGTPPVAAENSKLWVKESALVSKEQAIEMTHQNLVEFLSKYLTKADVEYAQARIDAANAYYPQIRDLNIRTKGFAPPAVEATPMTMKLADGSVVYFKGGYFPLVRDSRKGSAPSGQNRLSATDEYPGAGISTMRTDAASSKGRIGGNYPVKLDRGCEITPIMDTIHDICYREAMMDFRKILNDAEIFAELKTKLGEQNVRLLREQLETCANPYSNKQAAQAEELLSKTADALRRTATNGAIMLNLKTAAQNFSNILLYGNSVEGFTHADAFRAMSRAFTGQGRADVDAICRKSAFMRERMETPDVALNDIKNRKDLNVVERNTLKYGARLLGYTDMLTAKPVFAEAYMKKINEGASEQAAIDFANRVVRRTLGSSRMQDVSSLQRGSRLFRLFTMFQGFFNTQFNQWDREYHIMRNLWNDGEKKELIERLIAFVSAKFLGACLMNVAIAELSLTAPFEKDKDGYRKISKELLNYPISMGGPIGQFSNVALQNLLGMKNYGYRLTATQGLLDKGLTAARRTGDVVRGEKEASTLFEPTAYTIGAAFGVPGSVFNLIFNGYDIYNGTMDAELADIMSRRPKNERKPEEQLEKERKKY